MIYNREVTIIEAKESPKTEPWEERQLQVAAYCRVSTSNEEQASSFESQKAYYTEKIMCNKKWIMAGIYADEGLSGTSAKKRPSFQKMLRDCKKGKIDLILTKSVSRFSRNTIDCIHYARELRGMGIAIHFEKENVNTLEMDSEFTLTILGSLAQSESENISKNVSWGKRQAMKSGKINFPANIYGFKKDENRQPQIVSEQAEVVKRMYNWFLSGASTVEIAKRLSTEEIPTPQNKLIWRTSTIAGILKNEKYCGDILGQKTFITDVISKRSVKNNGQLPKYLIKNHHDAIVSREIFCKVQSEMEKRYNRPLDVKAQKTHYSKHSGVYALSKIMICDECGTAYRRIIRTKPSGEKLPTWRCISRLEHGLKYCKKSPSILESALQEVLLKAICENIPPQDLIMEDELPVKLVENQWTYGDKTETVAIKRDLIGVLETICKSEFEMKLERIQENICKVQQGLISEIELHNETESKLDEKPLEWNETMIRSLVNRVIVREDNSILIRFRNGKSVVVNV